MKKKQYEHSKYFDRPRTCRTVGTLDIYFTSLIGLYYFQQKEGATSLINGEFQNITKHLEGTIRKKLGLEESSDYISELMEKGEAQYITKHDDIVCVGFHNGDAAEIRINGRTGYIPKSHLLFDR